MNKKKSLIYSIVLILVLGLVITTGTFAYLQWQASVGTGVNVTIEMGGIKMFIEPEETGFVGLYPTANCLTNYRYGDALVRIENSTGALAIPSFKLKVAVEPSSSNLTALNDYKDNIHYAVVALETTKTGSKKLVDGNVVEVGGNTLDSFVTGTCKAPLNVSSTTDNDNTFKTDYGKNATGLFNVITAENTYADTPMLPREYNYTTGKVQGVTFRGEAYSTSYQWYRVYVWIDEGYTTTIIGDTVSDPLQNAQIKVTWSENSMLQQVSGVSNVEENLEAGLYDGSGNLTYTWQQLLDNGDITVEDNIITASDVNLTGKLVVPYGITRIGDSAFSYDHESGFTVATSLSSIILPSSVTSIGGNAFAYTHMESIEIPSSVEVIESAAFIFGSLKSVTFANGSRLTTVGELAFHNNSIESIKIPSSVTTIGAQVFYDIGTLNLIEYEGTIAKWNSIEKGQHWNSEIPATEVICSDGVVTLKEAGLYDENWELVSTWSNLVQTNDITVSSGMITDSNPDLNGNLVIASGITSIGYSAFNSSNIESFSIPATVTNIGDEAFYGADIKNIYFLYGSNLTTIEDNVFQTSSLTGIKIPASVTSIGEDTFANANLNYLIFEENSQLNTIVRGAFSNNSISSLELPSSVKHIGLAAFAGNSISNVEIPKGIITLGDGVFDDCLLLNHITYKGTKAQWNAITFEVGDWDTDGWIIGNNILATKVKCTDGDIDL